MSWEMIFCWIESHPGLASWVQAVGSIGAIFVAIGIASGQHRKLVRAEREKDIRVYEMIKILSDRAARAVNLVDANPFMIENCSVQILGLRKTFESINTLSLPHAGLVEPISTIKDALQNLDTDLFNAKREGRLMDYVTSETCTLWTSLVLAASIQIDDLWSRANPKHQFQPPQ